MTRFLNWSVRAYRSLLILYPHDLRRDFGPEMLEAFADDLTAECAAHGIRGALRVWRIALREVIQIGVPAWLEVPAVAVSAFSTTIAILSQSPLLILTIRRHARPGDATPLDALIALAIVAAVTALTSFLAAYRWKRANPISLSIPRT